MKAFLASVVLYQAVLSYSITTHSHIKKTKKVASILKTALNMIAASPSNSKRYCYSAYQKPTFIFLCMTSYKSPQLCNYITITTLLQ